MTLHTLQVNKHDHAPAQTAIVDPLNSGRLLDAWETLKSDQYQDIRKRTVGIALETFAQMRSFLTEKGGVNAFSEEFRIGDDHNDSVEQLCERFGALIFERAITSESTISFDEDTGLYVATVRPDIIARAGVRAVRRTLVTRQDDNQPTKIHYTGLRTRDVA